MAVPPVSIDDFALATVATRPDEAGGPPPQVLRATGQPRVGDLGEVIAFRSDRQRRRACCWRWPTPLITRLTSPLLRSRPTDAESPEGVSLGVGGSKERRESGDTSCAHGPGEDLGSASRFSFLDRKASAWREEAGLHVCCFRPAA